jgi:hypothetical protein
VQRDDPQTAAAAEKRALATESARRPLDLELLLCE